METENTWMQCKSNGGTNKNVTFGNGAGSDVVSFLNDLMLHTIFFASFVDTLLVLSINYQIKIYKLSLNY
jgi:hypothetical protein